MSQTILVTGASSGIGAACARKFLYEGWQVGLFARRAAALEALAGDAANAHVLPGDVTDADAVAQAVAALVARTGRLDAVFANAGIFTPEAAIDETGLDDWERAVSVNLTGVFLTARAAFAQMRRQVPPGGRILINGSVSAQVPRWGAAPYTATKHALTGLTKQIALDGRALGITAGQIDIGNARSEMMDAFAARARSEGWPEPETFDVAEVARAVWHMATLPEDTTILNMTIMAPRMPLLGRG